MPAPGIYWSRTMAVGFNLSRGDRAKMCGEPTTSGRSGGLGYPTFAAIRSYKALNLAAVKLRFGVFSRSTNSAKPLVLSKAIPDLGIGDGTQRSCRSGS